MVFFRGLLASVFVHFGGRGGQNGVHFGWFLGLVASMGALDAQFAPGPPSPFQPRFLFNDFGAQRQPKGVPKWTRNQEQINPQIDAKNDAIFYDLWSVFG